MTQPDPLQLQRLVDGELPSSQRAEFLSSIEEDSNSAWREVALAFVEEQIFAESLGSISPADVATEIHRDSKLPETSRKEVSPANSGRGWPLSGLVAMLLLGVAGFLAGRLSARGVPNTPTIAVSEPKQPAEQAIVQASPNVPDITVPRGTDDREVGSSKPNQFWQSPNPRQRSLEDELELVSRRLQQHGYRFDTKTEYIPARFPDGREDIVPVRTLTIDYHGL